MSTRNTTRAVAATAKVEAKVETVKDTPTTSENANNTAPLSNMSAHEQWNDYARRLAAFGERHETGMMLSQSAFQAGAAVVLEMATRKVRLLGTASSAPTEQDWLDFSTDELVKLVDDAGADANAPDEKKEKSPVRRALVRALYLAGFERRTGYSIVRFAARLASLDYTLNDYRRMEKDEAGNNLDPNVAPGFFAVEPKHVIPPSLWRGDKDYTVRLVEVVSGEDKDGKPYTTITPIMQKDGDGKDEDAPVMLNRKRVQVFAGDVLKETPDNKVQNIARVGVQTFMDCTKPADIRKAATDYTLAVQKATTAEQARQASADGAKASEGAAAASGEAAKPAEGATTGTSPAPATATTGTAATPSSGTAPASTGNTGQLAKPEPVAERIRMLRATITVAAIKSEGEASYNAFRDLLITCYGVARTLGMQVEVAPNGTVSVRSVSIGTSAVQPAKPVRTGTGGSKRNNG